MTDDRQSPAMRRPAAFRIEEPMPTAKAERASSPSPTLRRPQSFSAPVDIVPDEQDVFIGGQLDDEDKALTPLPRRRKRFSFAKLAAGAFGIVLSIAIGVWIDDLVRTLFQRAPSLAWATLALVALGAAALLIAISREIIGIYRLKTIQSLRQSITDAAGERASGKAREATAGVVALLSHRPETAAGRATLAGLEGEIVDGPQLIELVETELMTPLDRQARRLILDAAKRVSVVTAVSPRAVVDLAYVAYEATRLVRAMATLYGGRPGAFGMIRLMRDTIAHLAITGTIAVGDGVVQQIFGHGVAARLSSKLGEGVVNGMMTARIGIAAMDLCRPMPFRALHRPRAGDFLADLTKLSGNGQSSKDKQG
ncbi:MAG TPA: TIGR01620 family protein [Pararhizobium sp.]|nr:TIGR01620 family protein [Pararhizobium sp.]